MRSSDLPHMEMNGLREAQGKQPFEPFIIRLADGRAVTVPHPELLAVGKRRAILIQEDDTCLWLEPVLIVSIEWPGRGKSKDGNGAPKRKRPSS